MVFNSATFLCFFVLVVGFSCLPISWRARKSGLLAASYLFYMAWNPPFVILLWISTAADWIAARRIFENGEKAGKRGWLFVSLAINLGLLGFFKYGGFFMENFSAAASALGVPFHPAGADIVLPAGISFYTFQTMSYTLDVYAGRGRPWDSFLDFALYVTFFPQLVAGPIVRSGDFLPQCAEPRRADADAMGWGAWLIVFGLFQKEFMADFLLAPLADRAYAISHIGFVDAWVGTLAFAGQIFFDFSGYSTCAIGAALCLGFSIQDNFRSPYGAVGFSDFWRRWHMSLSAWFRDYLYIPLGGGRRGEGRAAFNLLFTMLACGLWHGASWGFVVWGGVHGSLLLAERLWRRFFAGKIGFGKGIGSFFPALFTFAAVTLAWVFFRAPTLAGAMRMIDAMLTVHGGASIFDPQAGAIALGVAFGLFAIHWVFRERKLEDLLAKTPWWALSLALTVMTILILLAPRDDRVFIYFQF